MSNYFTGALMNGSQRTAGSRDSWTHHTLADQKRVEMEMSIIYHNLNHQMFTWVNDPSFMPVEYTDKLTKEFTVLKFDKNVFPDQTPAESVSRIFGMSKEQRTFRSKRYGLAMIFEVDNMMTPEGQEEFAMTAAKITTVFVEHIAFLSLSRLLSPNSEDIFYQNQYGTPTIASKLNQIKTEIEETFAGHKTSAGPFPTTWKYRQEMIRNNPDGGAPNYVILNPDKQGLFKFGMARTSEYNRAGPPAEGMLTGYEELQNIQGMSFRGLPSFAQDVIEDGKPYSMLTRRAEIGNYFVWRNKMLEFKPEEINIALQGYIYVWSEPSDGLEKIQMKSLVQHCGRWDDQGNLHEDFHQGVENDLFTFCDPQTNEWRRCDTIQDMDPKFIKPIIKTMTKAIIDRNVDNPVQVFDTAVETPWDLAALHPEQKKAVQFVRKLFAVLGGQENNMMVGVDPNNIESFAAMFARAFNKDANTGGVDIAAGAGLGDELGEVGGTLLNDHRENAGGINYTVDPAVIEECLAVFGDVDDAVTGRLNDYLARAKAGTQMDVSKEMFVAITQLMRGARRNQLKSVRDLTAFITYIQGKTLDELVELQVAYKDWPTNTKNAVQGSMFVQNETLDNALRDQTGVTKKAKLAKFNEMEEDSNAWLNHRYIDSIFFDDFHKGVARLILGAPITLDVFLAMIENDVPPPMEFVLLRPHMVYRSSAVVLVQGGKELGGASVGYPHVGISWTVQDKTGELHVTQWGSAYIRDYRRRCIIPFMFYEGTLGGANADLITMPQWNQYVDDGFYSDDPNCPAILACAIPIGSAVRKDVLSTIGTMWDDVREDIHYHSAVYYGKAYRLNDLRGDSKTLFERMVNQLPNTMCFQGTQVQCGGVDGSAGTPIENRGHHGIERPGDLLIRQTGMSVRENMTAPLVCR